MAQEASASKTANSFPTQRTEERQFGADRLQTGPSAESIRPLSLDRLLSGAVLTPGQALLVAVELLDAANGRETTDGERLADARLGAVVLTPSGEVEVGLSRADEGTFIAELLGQLLQNARRLPAHPKPEQLLLLHRLEDAAEDSSLDPRERARALEGTLVDTLGSGYRHRLSGQLAALVEAFSQVAPGAQAAVTAAPRPLAAGTPLSQRAAGAPEASRPVSRRIPPTRGSSPRPPHRSRALLRRRRRAWRVALVVLVVAAVLGGGYLLLRGPGVGTLGPFGIGTHLRAPSNTPTAQPSKQPRVHRQHSRAVPALAAPHAGPVTLVKVRKLGSCKPGARCPVRVTVHLRPAPTARTVRWKVGAARLCKRGLAWSGGTTVTARPGWTSVYARSSVRIPAGRSLALTALTTSPARAQSRPVPVTGSSLHC